MWTFSGSRMFGLLCRTLPCDLMCVEIIFRLTCVHAQARTHVNPNNVEANRCGSLTLMTSWNISIITLLLWSVITSHLTLAPPSLSPPLSPVPPLLLPCPVSCPSSLPVSSTLSFLSSLVSSPHFSFLLWRRVQNHQLLSNEL